MSIRRQIDFVGHDAAWAVAIRGASHGSTSRNIVDLVFVGGLVARHFSDRSVNSERFTWVGLYRLGVAGEVGFEISMRMYEFA